MSPLRLVALLLLGACTAEGAPGARDAALALHWTVETAEGRFLGSATGLGGTCLLTNQHVVVAAAGRPIVVRRGADALPVAQARPAQGVDAALLTLSHGGAQAPVLRAEPPAAGEWLAVAGAMNAMPLLDVGEAIGPAGSARYGRYLRAARLPVAPGFSGGPVVDGQGRLVGIVVAAAADSMADAQRLAAGRSPGARAPRTALLLDPVAVLATLGPAAAQGCGIAAAPEPPRLQGR